MSPQLQAIEHFVTTQHRMLFGDIPSPLKLQLLCYYAQGYMLAQDVELFPEDFEAWQVGPVIPELFRRHANCDVEHAQETAVDAIVELGDTVVKEVSDIIAAYGRYTETDLSAMTHRENPWIDARVGLPEDVGSQNVIEKGALRCYFAYKLALIELGPSATKCR